MKLSLDARLLTIALWTECNDGGAFRWDPDTLHARLFPRDDIDMEALLAELKARNFINCCEVEGRLVGVVRNFCKYQHPEKPRYVWDLPDEWKRYAGHKMPKAAVGDSSATIRLPVDDTSRAPRERVDPGIAGGGGGTLNVPNLGTEGVLRGIDAATLLAELKARNFIVPSDSDGLLDPIRRHVDDTSPTPRRQVGAGIGEGIGEGEGRGLGEKKDFKKGKKETYNESSVVMEGGMGGTTAQQRAASPKPPSRGCRLSADWKPSPEDREFAMDLGCDPDTVAPHFRDYWHSKPGQNGTKLDWAATWRNWCRTESKRRAPVKKESPLAWMTREFPNVFTGDEPQTSSSFTATTIDGEVVR
jgi:hypothetical protein